MELHGALRLKISEQRKSSNSSVSHSNGVACDNHKEKVHENGKHRRKVHCRVDHKIKTVKEVKVIFPVKSNTSDVPNFNTWLTLSV